MRAGCIGLGHFAARYAEELARLSHSGHVTVPAVVDVRPEEFQEAIEAFAGDRPEVFTDYRRMFAEVQALDFVIIGTGLHLHHPMLMEALRAGCHAVIAKPSTVTIQQLEEMIDAAAASRRIVAVDFQHIYATHTQQVKQMLVDRALGSVRDIVVKAIWPRPESYYVRNRWAGRRRVGMEYVLDGPMNNPHAHYLNNAFFFASDRPFGYARPTEVHAELYRAKPIEGEDTACMRVRTDTGVPVYAYLSLARESGGRITEIEVNGELGSARWRVTDAEVQRVGAPRAFFQGAKGRSSQTIRWFLECLDGKRERPLCTLEDTRSHVLSTNGAYESSGDIFDITADHVEVEVIDAPSGGEDKNIFVPGVSGIIERAADKRALFSEIGVPWAKQTRPFRLAGYSSFRLFADGDDIAT